VGAVGAWRRTLGRVSGPTLAELATDWQVDPAAVVAIGLTGGLYSLGAHRLAIRGRRWPSARTLALAGALAAAIVGTQSGVGRYEGERFWVHMIQHVLLGMVVPLLVVLSAPVTLALQSARPRNRRLLRTALHSRAGRVVTHPLVGWCLFGGGLVMLYLTPLLDLAARHDPVHLAVHAHIVGSGILFLAPLVGVDALPRRLPHAARLLALLVAVPFHAVVGLALASSRSPIDPDTYPSIADQRAAASLLWGAGELLALVAAAIVLHQWWTAEQRAAARDDRAAVRWASSTAGSEV
jgi:putative membrane protein